MRNTKLCMMDFAMYEFDHLQRRLEDMAQKGWLLDRVWSLGFFRFRRTEPKAVRYAVTYAPSGSAYNSRPTEAEEDLTELCRDAGWVKAASFAQMHIYFNPDPDATPLETDDAVLLDNLARAMRKQNLAFLLLTVLFGFNLYTQISNLVRWPISTWTSNLSLCAVGGLSVIIVFYLLMPLVYYLWLHRARKAVRTGMLIPVPMAYRVMRIFLWVFILLFLTVISLSAGWNMMVATTILAIGLLVTANITMAVTKAMNAPRWANIAVPIVVSLVVVSILTPLMLRYTGEPTATMGGAQPIGIEELIETDETVEREIWNESSSFLADRVTYIQSAGEERLAILILNTSSEFVWEQCLNDLERDQLRHPGSYATYDPDSIHRPNQGELWDAEYAVRAPYSGRDDWLVCWEGRLVTVNTTWELTQEQIDLLTAALRP